MDQRGRVDREISLEARCEGEHLVCSPCGKVAGCERFAQRLAGPGGAAVALAESTLDYTSGLQKYKLAFNWCEPALPATPLVWLLVGNSAGGWWGLPLQIQWPRFAKL